MAILKETEIKKNSDTATSPPSAGERHAATSAGRQNPPVPSASPPPTPGDIRFNESMTTADDMGLALVAIDNLVRWGLPERVCKASFDRLASEYPMGFRLMLIGWKRDGIGGLTSDDKNDRPVRAVEVHTGRSEEPIP